MKVSLVLGIYKSLKLASLIRCVYVSAENVKGKGENPSFYGRKGHEGASEHVYR